MTAILETTRQILLDLEQHQILAAVLFLLIHVAFAVLFLPCSPLTALAGLIWGIWGGLAISIASTLAATSVTFGLGRWVRRSWLDARFRQMSAGDLTPRIMAAIEHAGWRAVVLLQMNPIIPASSFGYFFGGTRLSFRVFFLSTLLANLLPQIALVVLGSAIRDAVVLDSPTWYLIGAFLLLVSLALISFIGRRIASGPRSGMAPVEKGREDV